MIIITNNLSNKNIIIYPLCIKDTSNIVLSSLESVPKSKLNYIGNNSYNETYIDCKDGYVLYQVWNYKDTKGQPTGWFIVDTESMETINEGNKALTFKINGDIIELHDLKQANRLWIFIIILIIILVIIVGISIYFYKRKSNDKSIIPITSNKFKASGIDVTSKF